MNMIKLVIKQKVKALISIVLINFFFCSNSYSEEKIEIININKPIYIGTNQSDKVLITACNHWVLNSRDIIDTFNLSIKHDDYGEINRMYYWLPCEIRGRLMYDGIEWSFVINAAATAMWMSNDKEIYWGCNKKACDNFFLLPYDGMR